MKTQNLTIKFIFFLSGFSALIYQVAWQRMLFTAFGVDLESITVIIAVFMAGLGIGAYFGGRIADSILPNVLRILLFFAFTELGIGVFGFFSPYLINLTQEYFLSCSTLTIALANFVLLLFPTFLMGCTLPLLTTYLQQFHANVGENIGWLYFTNTIGASTACLFAGFVLFNDWNLIQVIYLSASINLLVASVVFILFILMNKADNNE